MDTVYVLTKWFQPDDGSPGNQIYICGDGIGLVRTLRCARPFDTTGEAQAYLVENSVRYNIEYGKKWNIISVDKKLITNPPKF